MGLLIYSKHDFCFISSSNIASNVLLNDVWKSNQEMFNEKAVEHILDSANVLLQNADTSHMKTWRTGVQ